MDLLYIISDSTYFVVHSIFNWVKKWISISTISMAILFEPVRAVVLVYVVLEEKLVWTQVLGVILVLFSIVIFVMNEKNKKNIKKLLHNKIMRDILIHVLDRTTKKRKKLS